MKKYILIIYSIMLFLCVISCNKNTQENYQNVLNEYQEELETNPNNIDEIYLKRAKHYIKYNKNDAALKDFEKILSLNTDNEKKSKILAMRAWLSIDNDIKTNKDKQNTILKDIKEAMELNNKEPYIYISLALLYAYNNDEKEMKLNCNKAMEIDKNDIDVLCKVATIYGIFSNQTEDVFSKSYYSKLSLITYDSIIKNFPSSNEYLQKVYLYKGIIYTRSKESLSSAIDSYTKGLKISDNVLLTAKCYYQRGCCYMFIGKYKKAISDLELFQKIMKTYTLETDSLSNFYRFSCKRIGVCFFKIKKYEKAIHYLSSYIDNKKVTDDSSLISEAYYFRGCAYYNMTGKDDLALKDLYSALNTVTNDEFKKDINKAIEDIRRIKNKNKTLYPIDRRFISGNDVRMYMAMNQNYIYVIFPETRAFEGKGFRFEYGDWQTKLISTDQWTGDMLYELWATDEVIKECKDAISVAKAYYS